MRYLSVFLHTIVDLSAGPEPAHAENHAMMRFVFALLLVMLAPSTVQAEARVALLIGNQAYDASVGMLKNPHNDIALVAEALKKQHFEILPLVKDARRSVILGAVRTLVRQLNTSGAGSIGFLYYSGHGAAEKDTNINYLIPIDARDPGTTSFWDESLKLDDIMRLLDGARGAVKFVVFDACRNELQLPSRDTSKGLAPVAEQQGFFVAYASAPGRTASDRGKSSGPYAAALASELDREGLDHLGLFQNVKEAVIASTAGAQQPWESNGLTKRVYLTGEPTMPADIALWESVRSSNDISTLQRYLERFPAGVFAATAAQMIERLKTEAAQRAAAEQFEIQIKAQTAKQGAELQRALEEARKAQEALSIADQQRARADAIAEQARIAVASAQSERNAAVAREEELRKIQQQLKAESASSSTRSAVEVATAKAELERKLEAVAGEARVAREALAAAETRRQAAEQAAAKAQEQARLSQVAMESRVADVALPPQVSEPSRTPRFDGTWIVTVVCEPMKDGTHGFTAEFAAQVTIGVFHGDIGVKGKPGWRTLDGKINPTGSALLKERGLITDAKGYNAYNLKPGTPYALDVLAQFEATRGTGKRPLGRQCDYTFAKDGEEQRLARHAAEAVLARPTLPQADGLFTLSNYNDVAAFADNHGLILPKFNIERPDASIAATLRRFIGVWTDKSGLSNERRRSMIIISRVNKDAKVFGYFLYGPSTKSSYVQGPAGYHVVTTKISGDKLQFTVRDGKEQFTETLTPDGRILHEWRNDKGQTDEKSLEPVWVLETIERSSTR